ncbi:MAG: hypothetical protein KAH06_07380 [Desulfobacterales bacterium]|nr:hypothetical protein [Desulfobacterales bacterium]
MKIKKVKNLSAFYFVCCFVLIVMGCHSNTTIIDQKEYFFKKNSDLKEKYSLFAFTSFESRKKFLNDEFDVIMTILSIIKKKHPKNDVLIKDIDGIKERYKNDCNRRLKTFYGMSDKDILIGDTLYLYRFKDKDTTESGLIVLNNGDIRKKYPDIITKRVKEKSKRY